MLWPPAQPVEAIPTAEFWPPYCPRRECAAHAQSPGRLDCARFGFYVRACDGRRVQRFRCHTCRRTFSQQTFAFSYFLKRPELSEPIAAGLVAGSCHRALGRSLNCAPTTVTRRSARLGRHCLLLHEQLLSRIQHLSEAVVIDDFESFVGCQDYPCGLGTAVGQTSWFVYSLTHTPHRRGGRLGRDQKRRKRAREARYGPAPRGDYARSMRRHLDLLFELKPERLQLVTDAHRAYRTAVTRHPRRAEIAHRAYPNPRRGAKGSPRSAAARQRDAALFPADLLHRLWRHSKAHHRRETIAFARRDNAALERGFLAIVWRNLVKPGTERKAHQPTPAMQLGLVSARWRWQQVLSYRLQPSRHTGTLHWMEIYRRELKSSMLKNNPPHALKLAF